MLRLSSLLLLIGLLTAMVFAQVPYQGSLEDYSCGSTDPLLSDWGLDVVVWNLTSASYPHPTGRSGSGILNNYMYVFGSGLGAAANWGLAFNLATNQWVESTPCSLGYDNWAGVATNNAIYLVGRYSGSYGAELQKFTPTGGGPTGTWTLLAPLPVASCGKAAAWDGGDYIYAAGGNPTSEQVRAYRYSISGNTWTQLPDMPIARAYCGGAYLRGMFYVFGGTTSVASSSMVAFNPATNTWSQMASSPVAVWFATFSTTFNSGYLFSVGGGGGYSSWPATSAVQIYDANTNTWTQDSPLFAAYGCNSARWYAPDTVMSTGGYGGDPPGYRDDTYYGYGFPIAVLPDLNVTMTPISPPIVVPATGGSFQFNAGVQRTLAPQNSFTAWARNLYPDGTYSGILLGPVTINPPVGVTVTRQRTQVVDAAWPAGVNWYIGYAGPTQSYPATDADSFSWTKLSVADNGPMVWEAYNYGEPFPGEVIRIPASHVMMGNYPNPFNPSTAISYQLTATSRVNLKVYDTAGRLVTTLVDGLREAGTHSVTFDGSNLASGVYVYTLSANGRTATAKMVLMK